MNARNRFVSCYLIVGLLACVNGLKCMTCQGTSFEECDVVGKLEKCMPNERSCETTVRRYGGHLRIKKGCKDEGACRSNQLQNFGRSGKSTQCNSDQTNSFCTCCCKTDMCNSGPPTCVQHYRYNDPGNACSEVPSKLPHGKIQCYKENKVGSVCEYQCTGKDYSVWPKGRDTNVCQRNGTWAHEPPCCARPCPPYFLFDDVFLFHFSGKGVEETFNFMTKRIVYGAIAEDATKISGLYFSGEPLESSVFKFNEYGADETRLRKLISEKIKRVNKGPINAGAAMRYALDNLLTVEAGMRDDRVPKSFNFITDRNPDDDLKAVGEEARKRGIVIYVLLFETEGYKLDHKLWLNLTKKEFISTFNAAKEGGLAAQIDKFEGPFCQNPCDHVMHDHE